MSALAFRYTEEKIKPQKIEMIPSQFNFFLTQIVNDHKSKCLEHGIELSLYAPLPTESAFIYKDEFKQVLDSLLNTAREAHLYNLQKDAWISLSFTQPGESSSSFFCISDNSIGSCHMLKKIKTPDGFFTKKLKQGHFSRMRVVIKNIQKHCGEFGYLKNFEIRFFHFTITQYQN
jgi:hypothetical protein